MDQIHKLDRPYGLEDLPLDAKVGVLEASPNISSLISLILTSSSFYGIFKEFPSQIVSAVLSNEIPAEITKDVLFLRASSRLPESRTEVRKFLTSYHPHPGIVATQIPPTESLPDTLAEALEVSKLHTTVLYLANDFCSWILSANPPLHSANDLFPIKRLSPNDPPSHAEFTRIIRVFYWFELHCNLSRKCCPSLNMLFDPQRDLISSEMQQLLFGKFYPWEIEQLGSIYDYLSRKLAPAFDDVVEHDVECSKYSDDVQNSINSEVLAEGLQHIHDARNFKDSNPLNLHQRKYHKTDLWRSLLPILPKCLTNTADDGSGPEIAFDLAAPPLSNEDLGPYNAWRWAHKHYGNVKRYCSDANKKDMREWGYCFWDQARLEKWNLFGGPFDDFRYNRWQAKLAEEKTRRDTRLEGSRAVRARIYRAGGRGRWEEGDESRITWIERNQAALLDKHDCVKWIAFR
ncbi:hypothetical protein MMC14_003456 [Varicellaria rhodocarpa]|nr:hypothetical protein [Varicellaria rhodocarpa]